MLLFSVRTEEAIRAYPRLMQLGVVQDDLFAEQVYEQHLGEPGRFDLCKEIVFRWDSCDSQDPKDIETAAKLLLRALSVTPVRMWIHGAEFCCNDELPHNPSGAAG